MSALADTGRRALGLVLALLLAVLLAGSASAQDDLAARTKAWDALATSAEQEIQHPDTDTDRLEAIRERLVAQRSEALAFEQEHQPLVSELNERLGALGPPPAEGASEAPEIAAMREDLQQQIAEAQAPVQAAQEAYRRTDALISSIDRTVRARFSAELMSRGPSPLRPVNWRNAVEEIGAKVAAYLEAFTTEVADPARREAVMRRVPIDLALIAAGLWIAIAVRRWLIILVERRLAASPSRGEIAWLVAVRNLARLVVPMVGAGLFFAAFDPAGLLARADEGRFFSVPPFVLVLIGAGWLAGSVFAPAHRKFRLVPFEDDEAWWGTRLILVLGVAVSLWLLFSGLALRWNLSTTTQSVLQFPPVLLGAAALWRAAALIDKVRHRLAVLNTADRPDTATTAVGLGFLHAVVRLLRIVAMAAPLIAAAGYLPLAAFLVFRSVLMLGLFGAVHVIFDLLNKTSQVFLLSPTAPQRENEDGLGPVVVGALVGLAALPFLAMIWGARPSDIADFWMTLREGVTFGGIRWSVGAIITLIVVFAIGVGLTRLLQTVLRGTVLPRTKLDAGGRSAVLAGVGYIGFVLSGLVAISTAGLNLSSLAIVAGALSVGIGFGLQNVVSNFVSGIILLVERPVKEGDWIEVGGYSGYVKGIKVRSTEIETFDRAVVILPNTDLVAGTVLNRTHSGLSGRLQVPVGVTYDADPKHVERVLLEIAESHPLVLEEPAPRVLFMELGPDSMNFELRCWLRDVNFSLSVRSDMNFEIIRRFRAEGIRAHLYGRDLPVVAPPEPAADAEAEANAEAGANGEAAAADAVTLRRARKES